jgi:pilus assembly protein Flp/PilA
MKKLTQFFKDEDGATAVEYGIMVALIAAVIITTVAVVGRQTDGAFNEVSTNLATEGVADPGATP